MQLHLYWIDKSRKKKGIADNYNLVINYDKKTFMVFTDPYYWYLQKNDIEIKRKSDIDFYVEYLVKQGFTREN